MCVVAGEVRLVDAGSMRTCWVHGASMVLFDLVIRSLGEVADPLLLHADEERLFSDHKER